MAKQLKYKTFDDYINKARYMIYYGATDEEVLEDLQDNACPSPEKALKAGKILAHIDAAGDKIVASMLPTRNRKI